MIKTILGNAVLIYVALIGGLYFAQRAFIYIPDKNFPVMQKIEDAGFIRVSTQDGLALIGWYSPAQPGKKTIVYFHGNAGNIAHRMEPARSLIEQGYGVLMAGYRGYGGNPGRPSEEGFYADARAYLDFLRLDHKVPYSDIVLYGESIGSGVAVQMAQENPDIAGVLLITPFTSLTDVAKKAYFYVPVDLLLKDRYDNAAKIGNLKMPVVFFLAGRDKAIDPAFGEALYQAAPASKKRYDFASAGHNTLWQYGLDDKVLEALNGL